MIFKITYEVGFGKACSYYKVSSLMRLIFILHGTYDFDYITEIKRLRRSPKGVELIEDAFIKKT